MTELEGSWSSAEDDDEKAEKAKRFLSALNKRRPSRKKYGVGVRANTPTSPTSGTTGKAS